MPSACARPGHERSGPLWSYNLNIAYVDETWEPKDAEDKAKMLAMEAVHMESLEALLYMAQMNECSVINELEKIEKQAKKHYQRLQQREPML